MISPLTRALTANEAKTVYMLRRFEKLAGTMAPKNRLCTGIRASMDTMKMMTRLGVGFRIIKTDPETETFQVMIDLIQFGRCFHSVARSLGMDVRIDGSILTADNQLIPADPALLGGVC